MEKQPKVSVVMPVYNAYDYLRPAIESILDQTLADIEIICIDDGSTDPSHELIQKYAERDGRIRLVTEQNAGPAHARNNGIRYATGEYIAFLDADDFFEPSMLEVLYDTAASKSLDIAISDYDLYHSREARFEKHTPLSFVEIFEGGKITSQNEIPDTIFQTVDGFLWNKLFRRAFLEEKGLSFPIEAKSFEDIYFIYAAVSLASRIGRTEHVLVHHRIHSEQLRNQVLRKNYDTVITVYGLFRSFLMHHGLYLPLSVSYVNLAAEACYTVLNQLPTDKAEQFWDLLHEYENAERIGFADGLQDFLTDSELRQFVVEVQLYSYRQVQRHPRRFRRLHPSRIPQLLKSVRVREKFRSFFKRKRCSEEK